MRRLILVVVGGLLVWQGSGLQAQMGNSFRARLSPVAIDLAMMTAIAGSGFVTAVLTGSKLTVTGTFEGLRSPATVAAIHKGSVTGVPGAALFNLTASQETSGTLTGTILLTPTQILDLEKGRLYVQLASQKAPDGNLWGWLLPAEVRR
jgi:CHRD domain